MLMNSKQVRNAAGALAGRVSGSGSTKEAIRKAFALALSRPPAVPELEDLVRFVAEQERSYKEQGRMDSQRLALTDLCQALLGLNEFVYVD